MHYYPLQRKERNLERLYSTRPCHYWTAEYIEDTDSQHITRLPLFISHGINSLEYRQFNYDRLMSCNEQLTRWIYKQLIHRFRQASLINNYHFMYSGLARDSGLLQQATEGRNRQKVKSSLNELVKRGVLNSYKDKARMQGRKIIDVKYIVMPTSEFISEQKSANKRAKDGHKKALESGLSIISPCE